MNVLIVNFAITMREATHVDYPCTLLLFQFWQQMSRQRVVAKVIDAKLQLKAIFSH